jgi:fibronectin-binding autotransporter adhesin
MATKTQMKNHIMKTNKVLIIGLKFSFASTFLPQPQVTDQDRRANKNSADIFIHAFRRQGLMVLLPMFLLGVPLPTYAVFRTWTGSAGDNLWSSVNNWSPVGAPQNGDSLQFRGPPLTTFTTNDLVALQLGSITNHATFFKVEGNGFTVSSGIASDSSRIEIHVPVVLAGNQTFHSRLGAAIEFYEFCNLNGFSLELNTEDTSGIGPLVSGDGSLNKIGTGSLNLDRIDGPISGGITISGGDLGLPFGTTVGAPTITVKSDHVGIGVTGTSNSWDGAIVLETGTTLIGETNYAEAAGTLVLSGAISGAGGLDFQHLTVVLAGSAGNTYTGTTLVHCPLLEFNKPSGINAYAGPLIVGDGSGPGTYEARWLNSYQNVGATATLYANGIINLNNHNEDFGPVTFNGGEIDTGTGQFAIYAPLTVNAAPTTAVINGYLGLPPGDDRVFVVGDGAADCDLLVNAVVFGSPTGHYFVKQGAGTMCLANGNSYNAPTLLEEGILDINNDAGLGTWPGLVIFNNATLRLSGSGSTVGGFEVVGAGVGGTHGAVEVLPNASFNLSGGILLDAATTINIGQGAGLGLNGVINGSGPLTKTGLGSLVLGGGANNTYSGNTVVSGGTLFLGKSANKISVPGNLIIGPAAAGPPAVARLVQVGGLAGTAVTVNANSLFDLNGRNQMLTSLVLNDGGNVQTVGGVLGFNSGGVVSVGSLNAFGSHATSTITGIVGLSANDLVTFNVSPHAPTPPLLFTPELDVPANIPVPAENVNFAPAGIHKEGSGRMRLGGNNTYKGNTTINGGTLQVDGSQPQSAVVVNSGAQLQGTGTAGIIYPNGGSGNVAPGNGPGILTCNNFNPGPGSGTLQVELNGPTPGTGYDQLNVMGSVTLTGLALSAQLNYSSAVNDQFTIINNDSALAIIGTFNGLPQNGNLYIGGQLFQISYTGGTGNDVVLSRLVTPPLPRVTIQNISASSIVFSWPTNDPAFTLQYNTDLRTNDWNPVLEARVIVGENFVVSNTPTGPQKLYRLIR